MTNTLRLGVNIDHVATVREARGSAYPDPVRAAQLAEAAGADGITAHLREDRRHISDADIALLSRALHIPLNLEMAATDEIIAIACDTLPDMVTLVPEKREEKTTEGGLDVVHYQHYLTGVAKEFHKRGIRVSLFIEPDRALIDVAVAIGADMVELHTGEYANAQGEEEEREHLLRIADAAHTATSLGLRVHAGHGLNYVNVAPIAAIEAIRDVSIGHAIIARAVFVGLDRAVREMAGLVRGD